MSHLNWQRMRYGNLTFYLVFGEVLTLATRNMKNRGQFWKRKMNEHTHRKKRKKLAQIMPKKSQETAHKLNDPESDERENKNDPDNRGDEDHFDVENEVRSLWLGMRDSNPRSWDQNPVPYRLANPQRPANCSKKWRTWLDELTDKARGSWPQRARRKSCSTKNRNAR